MTRDEIDVFIAENSSDEYKILLIDEMDGAFVGLSQEEGNPRAVYSIEKCIKILAKGMTEEEADEYFWYNVAGAKGEGYPLFINTPEGATDVTWTVSSSYLS